MDVVTLALAKAHTDKTVDSPLLTINPSNCFELTNVWIPIEEVLTMGITEALSQLEKAKEKGCLRLACIMGQYSDGSLMGAVVDLRTYSFTKKEFSGMAHMVLQDGKYHIIGINILEREIREDNPNGWCCAMSILT